MRIYWISEYLDDKLGMMAHPRGYDWLEDDIKKLLFHDVDTVVSLLEPSEISELGLYQENQHCQKHGIHFINYPIQDRGLPDSRSTFNRLVKRLNEKLNDGKKVVIHCRMGIGRTSMVCAALLIKNDIDPKNVFTLISETRTLQVPDTPAQAQWIYDFMTSQV